MIPSFVLSGVAAEIVPNRKSNKNNELNQQLEKTYRFQAAKCNSSVKLRNSLMTKNDPIMNALCAKPYPACQLTSLERGFS